MSQLTRGWEELNPVSKIIYKETYFLPDENYDEWLERVTSAYSNDIEHKKRMKNYIRLYWFHPSTPPSSNAGTDRGLPISCYTKDVEDTKSSIFNTWNESFWLGANGGGVGTGWSSVRSINEPVGDNGGKSSGVIPFLKVPDSGVHAVSQGGIRRFNEAAYLSVSHPEIFEFIDIRKPTGDPKRRTPELHHGVVITDAFMEAVIRDEDWNLVSPKTNKTIKTVKARKLWNHILDVRSKEKGEPYLLFIDTVNKHTPIEYKKENITVTTSNLCSEITLRTDKDNTGVCCLGSFNLEYYDEWSSEISVFIPDCLDFLDNILQDFINRLENIKDADEKRAFQKALNSAKDERSIGLGAMGWHSFLQKKNIPFESSIAKGQNIAIFKNIYKVANIHNEKVAAEGQQCPMSKRNGTMKRNIHMFAIAPTMSISNLCNMTSSGIEPWITNAFTKKLTQGAFPIQNKYLDAVIKNYAKSNGLPDSWINAQWVSIKKENGSVAHLDWMNDWNKDVFKTAFEIDQSWLIEFAADRQTYICQSQSLNLFVEGGSNVQLISDLHILAWVKGVKSLYYQRSRAINRASTSARDRQQIKFEDMMEDTCKGCA